MNEKTILEFANDLGISKKKLENELAKLKRKGTLLGTLIGGVRYLNEVEQDTIKEWVFHEKEVPHKVPKKSTELGSEFNFFKNQLEEKDKQISMLQQALDQQQILTKQALDDKQQLQLELTENQNKNFWKRLFKK